MHRCLELAQKAAGYVAPNPMVGAVLVHGESVIGEGYHMAYGGPHAEVNCIHSVPQKLQHLIPDSTMYVSLEPCAHHGKTPPCADLLIRHGIRKVIIGCRDPFEEVDGKGIEKLARAGVVTQTGVLGQESKNVNKRFFTFHTLHRPYIILKWAQTGDRKIGYRDRRLHITDSLLNRLVHKWRSEEASILIGTNTAATDDPLLTNRLWSGPTPVRAVVDLDLRLPPSLHLFDGTVPSIIFNTKKHEQQGDNLYYQLRQDTGIVHQIVQAFYQLRILSVLIEGGAQLLQSFIDKGYWDEARVVTNDAIIIGGGISAPALAGEKFISEEMIGNDLVQCFVRT